ncbi:MAG: DRTGG domain-containing protein [Anaerolineae bacterium]
MTVEEIVSALSLQVVAGADSLNKSVTGGYASDLLSCVMAGASAGNAWVTLQAHVNVIAVATLLDLACVVITEGVSPDEEMLARANEKGIPTLLTQENTFAIVGKLNGLGIHGSS